MNISTVTWGWPQWVMLGMLFFGFSIRAALHGKPLIDKAGEPVKFNGFTALGRFITWLFVLVAGGFFS